MQSPQLTEELRCALIFISSWGAAFRLELPEALCHDSVRKKMKIVLVGNSNVGKSVIFNRLTGQYVYVSNYPGTTVTVARGTMRLGERECQLVDTPGVGSLIPQSEDERVAVDILLSERPDVVVLVADAKNLRRSLLLMSQLAELRLPTVLDLNMVDESKKRGIELDLAGLAREYGIPVVETVATEGHGISELLRALARPSVPLQSLPEMARLSKELRQLVQGNGDLPSCLLAEWMVAGDQELKGPLSRLMGEERLQAVRSSFENFERIHGEPPGSVVARSRRDEVDSVIGRFRRLKSAEAGQLVTHLGRWCREPLTGLPILIGVLFLVYSFVGMLGAGTAVDYLEQTVFGSYLVPATGWLIDRFFPVPFVRDLLVGPYGLISMGIAYSVAIVLPVVSAFFLAFGFLEDSGYLPRLSVLADRVFRFMGLNGKAVLPMVLGLSCVTMATLTTRILATRKERLLATLLLALAVPCAAQLGVILGMLAWVSFKAVLLLFAILALQLLLVGWIADKIIPGRRSDFMVELPPMRWPLASNLGRKTWLRVRWFLREAVPLFVLGTAILFSLNRVGILPFLVKAAEPVMVGLLGLPAQAGEAFVMGFLRRDYGAAGLFHLAREGLMDRGQILVSLVTMTLFVPCVANFFVIIKEHSLKKAALLVGFIIPYALLVGAMTRLFLRWSALEL